MNKAGWRRKLAGSGLVLVAALAGGGTATALLSNSPSALAATVEPAATTTTTTAPGSGWGANTTAPMASALQKLVANGTITQAQATAVRNALIQDMRNWRSTDGAGMMDGDGMWASTLDQLVKDGTITQSQATAVTEAMAAQVEGFCGSRGADGTGYGMMGGSGGWTMGRWGAGGPGPASSTGWDGSSMM